MTANITTLAINLLIAGRKGFRETLADRIMVMVAQLEDASGIEKEMKSRFLVLLNNCVENPNGKSRDDFYLLAEYYNRKANGGNDDFNVAAA